MPDLSLSTHLNTRHVLGNTLVKCYFGKVLNRAFHDLTTGKSVPPAAHEILGLSLKFIPTPEFTTTSAVAANNFARLERDVGLKCFFNGSPPIERTGTKLFVKSPWNPPPPPIEIDTRLSRFGTSLSKIFKRKQGKPNLNKFQHTLLEKLVTLPHTPKG